MKFSEHFKLDKEQPELDFVDIALSKDSLLFIDPFAISLREDKWSQECHHLIVDFFQKIVDAIREGKLEWAKNTLNSLHEPNETRLGFSSKKPRGRGMGKEQSQDLYKRLTESNAVKTGFLQDLADCELVIPGIDRDKISDMTTNILRLQLAQYTKEQCELLSIPTTKVPLGVFWDPHSSSWKNEYAELPIYKGNKILLVPKAIVRYRLEYNAKEYYNGYVLHYLQGEEISAGTSLVRTLKSGAKKVLKKDLKKKYPFSKRYLYEFSKNNPEVIDRYKKSKSIGIKDLSSEEIEERTPETQIADIKTLGGKLAKIPTGNANAGDYHKLIIGILEAIFYPQLIYPKKEEGIHEGRKRIDIVFSNADREGFFFRLGKTVPCPFIIIECKNYSGDPQNPELDQLSGRFSPNRGKFGILVCRSIADKKKFLKRCKDTAQDDRGIIIALDDKDLLQLLEFRANDEDYKIDSFLDASYRSVVM